MSVVLDATELPRDAPHVSVAIVGAGACGLTAAIALRDAGLDAVLIERSAAPGGSTALSSGFVPAAGTRWQREAGIDDDPRAFAADIQAKARGHAAPHLVAAYTQAAAPALERLAAHGLRFELLDGFLYPGHAVRRMHAVPERSGAALVGALEGAARAAGADLLCNARAETLYVDGASRVQGIGCERPDGTREALRCDAMLLACNGFGGNRVLVAELIPALRDAPFAGHAGNDGTAIAFGRALGAALADLGAAQGHGSWIVPHGVLMTWAPMTQGAVQVNAEGRRFHDETGGYSEAAAAVLAQPGGVAWNVIDEKLLALCRDFADFRAAEDAGAVRRADGPAELSARIGCDVAVLAATLAGTALVPPYFAVQVTGALFHTQGGLDIDADCRARRAGGGLLPNLWAAGGAARGVSGNGIDGYLSGNGLLSAIAGGDIAARSIAEVLRR